MRFNAQGWRTKCFGDSFFAEQNFNGFVVEFANIDGENVRPVGVAQYAHTRFVRFPVGMVGPGVGRLTASAMAIRAPTAAFAT